MIIATAVAKSILKAAALIDHQAAASKPDLDPVGPVIAVVNSAVIVPISYFAFRTTAAWGQPD
jgi:hypothetical protein